MLLQHRIVGIIGGAGKQHLGPGPVADIADYICLPLRQCVTVSRHVIEQHRQQVAAEVIYACKLVAKPRPLGRRIFPVQGARLCAR